MATLVRKQIDLPVTGEDWELYTSKKGCGAAARGMTRALKKALKAYGAGERDAWQRYMEPAFQEYREYGAWDSEPVWVARRAYRDAFGGEE